MLTLSIAEGDSASIPVPDFIRPGERIAGIVNAPVSLNDMLLTTYRNLIIVWGHTLRAWHYCDIG